MLYQKFFLIAIHFQKFLPKFGMGTTKITIKIRLDAIPGPFEILSSVIKFFSLFWDQKFARRVVNPVKIDVMEC